MCLECGMKLTDLFLAELDREAPRTRRAVEGLPAGRDDWAPHAKSMPLARLAGLIASMPSWVTLIIDQDSLDLGTGQYQQPTIAQLPGILDRHVETARQSLAKTSDDYLLTTNWKLTMGGKT